MAYKSEQLPFKEFEDTVRELKRIIDRASPHYPLIAIARDKDGQELCWTRYDGPYDRPEVECSQKVEEWDCPVTVEMYCEDKWGLTPDKVLEKVTPRKVKQDLAQLRMPTDDEWVDPK